MEVGPLFWAALVPDVLCMSGMSGMLRGLRVEAKRRWGVLR
jgi:hypothetical protein